jgi:TRAP-type C4-dicarboxylate transport system permease small subunit
MARFAMRVLICVLGALAIGCATYLVGAIVWSIVDPLGAGKALLFTIPIAIVAMGTPALLALVGLINLCNLKRERRRRQARTQRPHAHSPADELDIDDLRFAA